MLRPASVLATNVLATSLGIIDVCACGIEFVRVSGPILPFDGRVLSTILFRKPMPEAKSRTDFLKTIDKEDAPS